MFQTPQWSTIPTFWKALGMGLRFQPKEGAILICDFVGLVTPEMVKKRPVVIIKKHRHNSKLVTLVPLSTTAPDTVQDYHVFLPAISGGRDCWAKCDMVYTFALHRLDRVMVRDRRGNRVYKSTSVTEGQLLELRRAVQLALGIGLDN